jgi:hypothetical protein
MRNVIRIRKLWVSIPVLAVATALLVQSCGEKEMQYDTNLLKNGSFESIKGGLPKHWTLANFRGLEGQQEAEYGVDNSTSADGDNSWFFRGDPGTRRWYVLNQEVEVRDITHVRVSGWMQIDQVERKVDQYAQCNFLLTFYDEDHNRFQELRFADKRSRLKVGTIPWFQEDLVFRVPKGTRYVVVSCILGCDGTAWFDNVELSVPRPLDWQTQRTKNFVFYSLPERPFPTGAVESQQRLFDYFAGRLGIESNAEIGYYLYPDTATIRDVLSLKGHIYISYDDLEIHTINPNDNHEVIHFITDAYGVPPKAIAEGTVFWLHGVWFDKPVNELAAYYLAHNALPPVSDLIDYNKFAMLDPTISWPVAASFVTFIVDRWGTERLIELYKEVAGYNSYELFARAFEKVYGIPCQDVEEQWQLVLSNVKITDPELLELMQE